MSTRTAKAARPATEDRATRKTISISEEARQLLERRADEEHRSMTGHLEWLIEQDVKKAGEPVAA